jgi:enoyl-CoA hydratase/carnithine racemase
MRPLAEYAATYECARLSREDGVLEVVLHTDGGPLVWGEVPHRELSALWADIGDDPENEVVIITGQAESFCERIDPRSWKPYGITRAGGWEKIHREGTRLLERLLEIDQPIIAAINGPATVHAEIPVLADIVIASDTAFLQDAAHYRQGAVPGDGSHIIWPYLLGPNRGRYFLMTAEKIDAVEAQRLGVVGEVHPPQCLRDRAHEIARDLVAVPATARRYTTVALREPLRRQLLGHLSHGLLLEGAAMAAAAEARARP